MTYKEAMAAILVSNASKKMKDYALELLKKQVRRFRKIPKP